jgi:hypothetical protein
VAPQGLVGLGQALPGGARLGQGGWPAATNVRGVGTHDLGLGLARLGQAQHGKAGRGLARYVARRWHDLVRRVWDWLGQATLGPASLGQARMGKARRANGIHRVFESSAPALLGHGMAVHGGGLLLLREYRRHSAVLGASGPVMAVLVPARHRQRRVRRVMSRLVLGREGWMVLGRVRLPPTHAHGGAMPGMVRQGSSWRCAAEARQGTARRG